jgi:hypothetical protein
MARGNGVCPRVGLGGPPQHAHNMPTTWQRERLSACLLAIDLVRDAHLPFRAQHYICTVLVLHIHNYNHVSWDSSSSRTQSTGWSAQLTTLCPSVMTWCVPHSQGRAFRCEQCLAIRVVFYRYTASHLTRTMGCWSRAASAATLPSRSNGKCPSVPGQRCSTSTASPSSSSSHASRLRSCWASSSTRSPKRGSSIGTT